jgi:hypothetical protein
MLALKAEELKGYYVYPRAKQEVCSIIKQKAVQAVVERAR